MKYLRVSICTLYIFLVVSGSLSAIDEKTISLGGELSWISAEYRTGITELKNVRPYTVLALSSAANATAGYSAATGVLGNFSAMTEHALDLSVSFDERDAKYFKDSAGRYVLTVPPDVEAAGQMYARAGSGAALFGRSGVQSDSGAFIIKPNSRGALFAPNNRIKDFTIEFWLYPLNMENGERIFSWNAVKTINGSQTARSLAAQKISCIALKNRMKWSFVNFFTSTDEAAHINIEFAGNKPVVPETWSHHLIRFDASTGMVEYIVDGDSEVIVYATKTSRESSEVFAPLIGGSGSFSIGENFSGLMDELKIHSMCAGRSAIQKFPAGGGRIETKPVDLGGYTGGVIKVDVKGGRIGVVNEFRENGRFRFSDDTEINFFIRAGENPWRMNGSEWISFTPGAEIHGVSGRYVQIAADFYPSSDGETSPYLEKINIVYNPGEPPLPPRNLTAVASDGAVTLRWKHSSSPDTQGYLVYYSAVRGELFGDGASLGKSPIDAGMANNIFIDGLKNGTLYYFRVAAYNKNAGEFSTEVAARPLTGLVK